ncbi:dihydroxy-acid dehydratase, partial [Oscillospiraceae bacterium OttesenSCG-928-G22]|nr:dihydroxy-acid dehydratase [Oscillospiraceae bacterium OttesenSCG-928-G22]
MSEKHIGMYLDEEYISNRGIYKGTGVSDDDLRRPVIGIANSFSDMVPGHTNLRHLAQHVKYGVYRAGGTPLEFGTAAVCDGVATGHCGGNYALPSRENIADTVELQAIAHQLDGLVLMASCDKIVPAMLMAAARLDIPCIFINGGCMMGGPPFAGAEKADASKVTEALGMQKAGKIPMSEVERLTTVLVPTAGSGQFYGTANTMCCLAEALGMCLPGAAAIPAPFNERQRAAFRTGEAIVGLVEKNITARKIITMEAIENAIMVLMATGGSTNAVLHLCALAHEIGVPADEVISRIERLSEEIPQIVAICPASGRDDVEEFYYAGGVPEVMRRVSKIHRNALTVTGATVGEN